MENQSKAEQIKESCQEELLSDSPMISEETTSDHKMDVDIHQHEDPTDTNGKNFVIKQNSDTNEDWTTNKNKSCAKEKNVYLMYLEISNILIKILPEDYIINIDELLINPQPVPRESKFGVEREEVKSITKYVIQEGKGELPLHKDKVVYLLELRYSSGLIYELSKRKEQKSNCIQENKQYAFFLDIIKSMRTGEVALFKIQFKSEDMNFYFKADAVKYLTEEKMSNIKDKSIIYMKIKVISIKRDYDSPDANKSILSRIIFGEEIKQHATLALTEGDFNFFIGILSTLPKSTWDDAEDNPELLAQKEKINQLCTSLLLNQGLCYWKKLEMTEMRRVNKEILTNYDTSNIKAKYRLAVADKELGIYDEGLEAIKSIPNYQSNKEFRKICDELKKLSKEKTDSWNSKMSGFFSNKSSKYHKIEQEDANRQKLIKKIEVELNSDQ